MNTNIYMNKKMQRFTIFILRWNLWRRSRLDVKLCGRRYRHGRSLPAGDGEEGEAEHPDLSVPLGGTFHLGGSGSHEGAAFTTYYSTSVCWFSLAFWTDKDNLGQWRYEPVPRPDSGCQPVEITIIKRFLSKSQVGGLSEVVLTLHCWEFYCENNHLPAC